MNLKLRPWVKNTDLVRAGRHVQGKGFKGLLEDYIAPIYVVGRVRSNRDGLATGMHNTDDRS